MEFSAIASLAEMAGDDKMRFEILLVVKWSFDWAIRLEYKVGSSGSRGTVVVNGVKSYFRFSNFS